MIIYQEADNCIVEIGNVKHTIPSCNAMKFARTMWNKSGDKYTKEEMEAFGFGLKSDNGELLGAASAGGRGYGLRRGLLFNSHRLPPASQVSDLYKIILTECQNLCSQA